MVLLPSWGPALGLLFLILLLLPLEGAEQQARWEESTLFSSLGCRRGKWRPPPGCFSLFRSLWGSVLPLLVCSPQSPTGPGPCLSLRLCSWAVIQPPNFPPQHPDSLGSSSRLPVWSKQWEEKSLWLTADHSIRSKRGKGQLEKAPAPLILGCQLGNTLGQEWTQAGWGKVWKFLSATWVLWTLRKLKAVWVAVSREVLKTESII